MNLYPGRCLLPVGQSGVVFGPLLSARVSAIDRDGDTIAADILPLLGLPAISNVCTKAVQLGNRPIGYFANARAITSRSVGGSAATFGGSLVCCSANWRAFLPEKGNVAVSSS